MFSVTGNDDAYRISTVKELEAEQEYGVIVYINKYNLVPIFQTKLTLNPVGEMQIKQIFQFSEILKNCTEDQYQVQLEKWCNENNISQEDYLEQLGLFANLKLTFDL